MNARGSFLNDTYEGGDAYWVDIFFPFVQEASKTRRTAESKAQT